MATNVFISFRSNDGMEQKERLVEKFGSTDSVVDYSEDIDRSGESEETIRKYLYDKLRETSVTIVILTPNAIRYKKDYQQNIDDWMYDELRYSLEDRENNRTNGAIALYTEPSKQYLIKTSRHTCDVCNIIKDTSTILSFDNLVRKNVMNIKEPYKLNKCKGLYDRLEDSYISLVSFEDFIDNSDKYISNAVEKRDRKDNFDIRKRMQDPFSGLFES